MWKWLEKVIGHTSEQPLVLTKEVKRARTKKGRYKGDDKSTANYNEAWVGGTAPKKIKEDLIKKRIYKIQGKKYVLKD